MSEQTDRVALMRALFPGIAKNVDAAYSQFAGEREDVKLDHWLDRQAARVLPGAATLVVDDAAIAARFDTAFAKARAAAALLGLDVPEIESFEAAGVDLEGLADAIVEDPTLVPVVAPHGLGEQRWVNAYARLGKPSLLISDEASKEFELLDSVQQPAPPTIRLVDTANESTRQTVTWTLRLIPAAAAPPLLGLSFANGPHVGLSEMLMLQLMRAVAGEPPLDATTFTWLAGVLAAGRLAARHVYDASEDTIRITCREVVSQGPHLGARPPIG
ncbi:hypothetical protein QBL02_06635 [Leucobacter sp. UT-8R-CII-1-4]|uniref:hypothetical protein n=1 Tax=Leucobacter sp. UT-8R-CII-1-4 TaxID=3040075 RepID=UPI0024A8FF32|nr:hypothetical protein [Leucobacter sp. UT-8R-CII-1-4]MDI6023219.1 hypothetical protein [Leucobacter sp. UT-8R-CII-1-4]